MGDADKVVARPAWKWVGGKAKLASKISAHFPRDWRSRTYREPFVGAGGMLFHVLEDPPRRRVVASDINQDLIGTYHAIRDARRLVCDQLDYYRAKHEELGADHYYQIRKEFNAERSSVQLDHFPHKRAAQFIYLNKTGYNGLWRTNLSGDVNVPVGRYAKTPSMYDADNMEAVARALGRIEMRAWDFDRAIFEAREGDFCYLDSPYVPVSKTANFASYSTDGFGDDQHVALAAKLRELDERGVLWAASNSHTPRVLELYHHFDVTIIEAPRSINSKGGKRGNVEEVLIRNTRRYP